MKFIFSEYQSDFSRYHFPYQVYLIKEEKDALENIYNAGFLPSRAKLNLFYLARSLRVDLSKFEPTSENRRILKKTEYLKAEILLLSQFEYHYSIGKLAKEFYEERFGKGVMSAFRMKWLFTSGACTHVFKFLDGEKVIGYCPVVKTNKILHYAYPFYDLEYFDKNAGMGMMLKSIIWAKENELEYVYLGTCYTQASLYKIQFEGLEFFTGYNWSSDTEKLKNLIRNKIDGHLIEGLKSKDEIFEKEGVSIT